MVGFALSLSSMAAATASVPSNKYVWVLGSLQTVCYVWLEVFTKLSLSLGKEPPMTAKTHPTIVIASRGRSQHGTAAKAGEICQLTSLPPPHRPPATAKSATYQYEWQ